jgi:hypothetical protein
MRVYLELGSEKKDRIPTVLILSLHNGADRSVVAQKEFSLTDENAMIPHPRKWAEGICQENGWTLLDERPALKRGPKPRAVAAKGHELYLSDAAWTRLQATASMRGVSASSLADEIFLKL